LTVRRQGTLAAGNRATSLVARRGLFRSGHNLLWHKPQDWLSGMATRVNVLRQCGGSERDGLSINSGLP